MAQVAQTSALGSVAWEAEDSFADADDDTITTRMQVRDEQIDVSGLTRELMNRGGAFQYLAEGDFDAVGAFGASTFSTSFYLHGHGGVTTGSLTQTDLCKLLAHVFGNVDVSQVGTTCSAGWDANTGDVASGAGLVSGGMLRIGELGDGAAEGQYLAVTTVATNTVTLATDAPGSPVASDVVYVPQMLYPVSTAATAGQITSDGSTSNNTLRFLLQTANLAFVCRGCVATGVSFELGVGNLPRITIEWTCAAWNPVSATFPNATASASKCGSPITAGSTYLQAKGTTTRATEVEADFAMTFDTGILPLFGQGGTTEGQTIVGYRRGRNRTTVSFSVESETVTATPEWHDYFATDPNSQVAKHILWTGSVVDGRAIGIYFRNCKPIGNVPTQTPVDGLNRVAVEFECMTDTAGADELRKAPWVLALG